MDKNIVYFGLFHSHGPGFEPPADFGRRPDESVRHRLRVRPEVSEDDPGKPGVVTVGAQVQILPNPGHSHQQDEQGEIRMSCGSAGGLAAGPKLCSTKKSYCKKVLLT